jgi:hypothetical protein
MGGRRLGRNPRRRCPCCLGRQEAWPMGGGPADYRTQYSNPLVVTTQPLQMLRLDRNSLNTEEGRPFVKMSVNYDVVGTWRTRT